MKIKCNKCGFVGEEKQFRTGRDFMQKKYISGCPKCDNYQSPGDASMRMFGGERPFTFIRESENGDALERTIHRANEAS